MSVAFLAALVIVQAGEIESVEVFTCYTFPAPIEQVGNHPEFTVCEVKLNSEPAWDGPGSSPAPLSMNDAITVARKQLSRYSEVTEWDLGAATIKRVNVGNVERWMYFIKWRATRLHELVLEIPVLMSGTAVDGKGRIGSAR